MITKLLTGLVAGWLTGILMRGSGYGLFIDVLLGLIGAVIGGWIFAQLHIHVDNGIQRLAMYTVGAVALVAITHLFHR